MDINLQPYDYEVLKPNYYAFTTVSGDIYECYFLPYGEYFPYHLDIAPFIFGFNLHLLSKPLQNKGVDKRIADTVIMIVGGFLEAQNNAMIYVCDNSDGKEKARARKFKSWFDYYAHPSHQITRITQSFEVGGMTIHSAMLIHNKNKRKMEFVDAYFSFVDDENK